MLFLKKTIFISIFSVLLSSLSMDAIAVGKASNIIELSKSNDGLFIINVTINDDQSVPMIIDTAAGMSALRESTVQALALDSQADRIRVHGLIGVDEVDSIKIDQLQSGNLQYSGPVIILEDTESISDVYVQGLLGTDFLYAGSDDERYLMIDFNNLKMVSGSSISQVVKTQNRVRLNWSKLESLNQDFKLLTFKTRVSGISATAIIDTGLIFTVANKELARRLNKRGRTTHKVKYTDINGETAYLHHLNIGKVLTQHVAWSAAPAMVYDPPAMDFLGLEEQPTLLLGLAHLKDMSIVIDRQQDRISFVSKDMLSKDDNTISCTGSRVGCIGSPLSQYGPGNF